MSKKQAVLWITVVLVLLCGCGQDPEITGMSQNTAVSADVEKTETVDNQGTKETVGEENDGKEDTLPQVCDRWADSGSFKIYTSGTDFFEFAYDYSVPRIVDDTEDAKEINDTIDRLFGEMHDTMQRAARAGEITAEEFDSTGWFQTNYDCYWNGSIAGIVIYSTGYYDMDTEYLVYNYDFATGRQLSNEDLFALKGISGEKFVEDLRRAAAYSLDREMQNFFEYEMPLNEEEPWYEDVVDDSVQHMYGDYLLARAKTIHGDNINEYLPVYLDEKGDLQAVTHLYNMSMYGEVTSILSPREWVDNRVRAYCGDLLQVVSKEDGIYLTIYRDDWSDEMHEEFPAFEFVKEYKIDGLYKNYTEAVISWVGNGRQPYILLLSDDGMISYVDVWEGIASEYFCAVEPLWGLVNGKSFGDDSQYRVEAVSQDGKTMDVEEALYMMLNCRYADFEKNMLNMGNVAGYSAMVNHNVSGQDMEYEETIGFTEDMYHMFVRKSCKTDEQEGGSQVGYITFNGMNEKGMVYCFSLVGEEGETRGTMAINVYSYWDGDFSDFVEGADVTWLGGLDIFESGGNRVMLETSEK